MFLNQSLREVLDSARTDIARSHFERSRESGLAFYFSKLNDTGVCIIFSLILFQIYQYFNVKNLDLFLAKADCCLPYSTT